MNYWKASTIALAVGLTFVAGKDVVSSASAATNESHPAQVGYDWGQEQPRMQKALDDLRLARHSLEIASEHRGGWRVAALQHTDAAIQDTINGMEYGRQHPHEQ